jgi:hypothetical protein
LKNVIKDAHFYHNNSETRVAIKILGDDPYSEHPAVRTAVPSSDKELIMQRTVFGGHGLAKPMCWIEEMTYVSE